MSAYKKLEQGYSLFDGAFPFPAISNNKIGSVSIVFEKKALGEEFIEKNKDALLSRKREGFHLQRVGNSFEFMQTCAKNGLAGIELYTNGDLISFGFGNRNEESGIELPTLILNFDVSKNNWQVKSRFNEYVVKGLVKIQLWERYDILDKVSAGFAKNVPFGNWNKTDFFEIRRNSSFLVSFHVPCLGNWNSLYGSVPFFSNTDLAVDFLKDEKFMSHLGSYSPDQSEFQDIGLDIECMTKNYRIIKINNLRERLIELMNFHGGLRWTINPNATRDSQVYGNFLRTINEEEISEGIDFYGISADWQLFENNRIEKVKIRNAWYGNDTFYWNSINSYKLNNLNRSFSNEISNHKFAGLSSSEIEELLALIFVEFDSYDDLESFGIIPQNEEEKLKAYTIIGWDTISGEGRDHPFFFNSIFDLIKWLWVYNCVEDHPTRLKGTATPFSIGVLGSDNTTQEQQVSESIKSGLKQIMREIILNGYQPKYSFYLSALINQNFKLLYIDVLGYCSDLLWQLDEDERLNLLDVLQVDYSEFEKNINDADLSVDVEGEGLALERMGRLNWNLFSRRSMHFIASSLSELKMRGSSPQLDYSGITIGFVKALEFELGLLIKAFLSRENIVNLNFDEEDRNESHIMSLAKNKDQKPLTLGAYSYLLNPNKRNNSELRNEFIQFVETLNGGEYLTSKQFWKKDLYKIREKYRNSGAHDSSIPESVCREALNMIIGTSNNEGVLVKAIKWKIKA